MKFTHALTLIALLAVSRPLDAVAQKPYRGAEYRTIGTMTYGRFEIRMRSAPVSGMLSSFFTYYDSASPWNEIDVETMGRYSNEIQFNTIVPTQADNHVQRQVVPFNPHAGFHVIGIEWTPDYVAWRVDGEEVYRQTGSHIALLTKPQKVMMNVWQPSAVDWAGTFSASQLPVYAYYDWVKYSSYTPGTGDNFTLQWTDDFTSHDALRWQKATHTWDGNNAQFVAENAVIQGGYLILCLTSNTTSGYAGGSIADQDLDPPYVIWARGYDSTLVVRFSEPVSAASAEIAANYFGGGLIYKSAKLRTDQRTVDVAVSGIDLTSPFILFAQNVQDRAPSPNTMSLNHVRVTMPLRFPIRIDVGGQGSAGSLPDSTWAEWKEYGGIGGTQVSVSGSSPIAGTTEPDLYRSLVHGLAGYNVRVPNGTYNVTLKMMEDRYATAGKRLFSAKIDGAQLFTDLDIFQQAGFLSAYDVVAPSVIVSNNVINIWMGASVDSTTLSGISIERVSGPTGLRQSSEGVPPMGFSVYPNPYNGSSVIRFSLPATGGVALQVHDTLGRQVGMMDLGIMRAGTHEYRWTNDRLASGSYFLTLHQDGRSLTHRIIVMR